MTKQRPKGVKSLDRRPRLGTAEKATQRPNKKPTANTRTALQRQQDLAFIGRHRLIGFNLDAIAEKLNQSLAPHRKVSRSQVYEDLKAVDQAWREEREQTITTLRDRELARLDADELELYEAWEKSKNPQGRRKVKQTKDGKEDQEGNFTGDVKTEKTFEDADSYGDPSIYDKILRIREIRAKICGWTAPVKVQHSGHDGGPLPVGAGAVPIVKVIVSPPSSEETAA